MLGKPKYACGDSLITLFCQRVEVTARHPSRSEWMYDMCPVDDDGTRYPDLSLWSVPEHLLVTMDEYDTKVALRADHKEG